MNPNPVVARRTVLTTGLVGAGAVALAACGSGSAPSRPDSTAASAPRGVSLVKLDAIAVGQAVSAKLADGSPVLVARPTPTTAVCFSAICTHLGCTVAPAGAELHCPCHGSAYDAATGKVIHGPAPRALSPVPVHVAGGQVVTGA